MGIHPIALMQLGVIFAAILNHHKYSKREIVSSGENEESWVAGEVRQLQYLADRSEKTHFRLAF